MAIRFGIIGCGVISDNHAQALWRHADAEIVACADLVKTAVEQSAARFAIPNTYNNPHELLRRSDLDAVVICVPPKWHAEFFLEALAEGKHVLCEKPLAMDLAEADRMVQAAMVSDRIVGVALVHRYIPAYHMLRDLIQDGAIGPVRQVRISLGCDMYRDSRFRTPHEDPRSWLVDRDVSGGGILMSSSVHFISVTNFILDNPGAARVDAKIRRLHRDAFTGIEDDVDLRVELAEGIEFVLHESWVTDQAFHVDLVGEHGRLAATGENWSELAVNGVCRGAVPRQYTAYLDGADFHAGIQQVTTSEQLRFDGLNADFIHSIQQGFNVPDMPDIRHARNMQAVIDAAYRSGRTGAVENVDWLLQPLRELR